MLVVMAIALCPSPE